MRCAGELLDVQLVRRRFQDVQDLVTRRTPAHVVDAQGALRAIRGARESALGRSVEGHQEMAGTVPRTLAERAGDPRRRGPE